MSEAILRPSASLGSYPERNDERANVLEAAFQRFRDRMARPEGMQSARFRNFLKQVQQAEERFEDRWDELLDTELPRLREQLLKHGLKEDLAARAFALVRQTALRTLGMHHHDEQVFAGWILLHGMLAEMDTGEGKTLSATLPACTAALAGIPVHVITANDYLAARDAEQLSPLYNALGLSVSAIREDENDAEQRREAYACTITYCTGKQVAFDYLRDRLSMGRKDQPLSGRIAQMQPKGVSGPPILRGLCFAIVDEADSILVDEAITPLILSREVPDSIPAHTYGEVLALSDELSESEHYRADRNLRTVQLTDQGKAWLNARFADREGFWRRRRQRNELVRQALTAKLFFERDKQYLVRDGKVLIIDQNTGRVMPDRSWELGLHQMIEAKEGCEISPRKETLARISFQRFFRRYLRLSGMTGTAREVAGELHSVYGLKVIRVPPHKASRREEHPVLTTATRKRKWRLVARQAGQMSRLGRPVLIGTRSVKASEELSAVLAEAGLEHTVLNARQDRHEAKIVARAGECGRITVATNMAGRGTDIKLSPEALRAGGLHTICAGRNEARRIDRQLFGRCGRHGDPGSYQFVVSLQDEILNFVTNTPIHAVMRRLFANESKDYPGFTTAVTAFAQRSAERRFARARHQLMKTDKQLEDFLAFTGPQE